MARFGQNRKNLPSRKVPEGGKTEPQAMLRFLEALHEEKVLYCSWKRNVDLEEVLWGRTDLDILVDPRESSRVESLLGRTGFKRFVSVSHRQFPGIEDYFSIDSQTGALNHLHLYYQLRVGRDSLKGYRLPWTHLMLSGRTYDRQRKIYVPEPNLSLILHFMATVLRLQNRDRFALTKRRRSIKGSFMEELNWLRNRIDRDHVETLCSQLLGSKEASKEVFEILDNGPNLSGLLKLQKTVWKPMRKFRTDYSFHAVIRSWYREFKGFLLDNLKKYLDIPVVARRTSPRGGMIVAILGSDGAGKSTIKSELIHCLSPKMDVLSIYFGSGDGPASLMRLPLDLARKLLVRRKPGSTRTQDSGSGDHRINKISGLRRLGGVLLALALAKEKRSKLRRAWKARNRGYVVICDRYPQTQTRGFNDGPLLEPGKLRRSGLLRWIKKWELRSYELAELNPPDIVIKLKASPSTAYSRKPETPYDLIEKKMASLHSLKFPPETSVEVIDAEKPIEEVILAVKLAIWKHI